MSDTFLRAEGRTFAIALISQTTGDFQVNPTIAVGDFQIDLDGLGFNNLTNVPVVNPAGTQVVLITLTDAEMDALNITIRAIDLVGDEWEQRFDFVITHVPDPSVAGISTGTALVDRTLLELRFGVRNIFIWADLDNDENATTIAARIDRAINFGTEDAYDRMRGGPIKVPISGLIPFSLANHVAGLAGVWLYTNRGINDVNDDGKGFHRLARIEKDSIEYFLKIRAGVIRLNIESQPEQSVWIPQVNVLQATADKILLPGSPNTGTL